ncbi:MAG: M50 family metallopeptidase [Bacteroidales bacterium]|nr:M50 family metallopeptidase [Bacteroidales bacterium]
MQDKKTFRDILSGIWYFISCTAIVCLILIALGVLVQVVDKDILNLDRLKLHDWLAYGFVGFFIMFLIPNQRSNTKWLMSFMHEFIHMVFAILFFRKVKGFHVDRRECYVAYDSGHFGYTLITLAPYFFPLLCLILLPWRYTTGETAFLNIIDILLGFTYAFHVCCWVTQTRLSQTDIINPGVVRSLLIITFFQIAVFCLLFMTPTSGVLNALDRVFVEYPLNTIEFYRVGIQHLLALI